MKALFKSVALLFAVTLIPTSYACNSSKDCPQCPSSGYVCGQCGQGAISALELAADVAACASLGTFQSQSDCETACSADHGTCTYVSLHRHCHYGNGKSNKYGCYCSS